MGVITIPNDGQNVLLGLPKSYIVSKTTAVNLMLCVCVCVVYLHHNLPRSTLDNCLFSPPGTPNNNSGYSCCPLYVHTYIQSFNNLRAVPLFAARIPVPVSGLGSFLNMTVGISVWNIKYLKILSQKIWRVRPRVNKSFLSGVTQKTVPLSRWS